MISSASGTTSAQASGTAPLTSPSAAPTFAEPEIQPGSLPIEAVAPAPLSEATVVIAASAPAALVTSPAASGANDARPLPLALLRHLLDQVSQVKLSQLADLVPALRILALALTAALVLKLTGAVLGSLNELPLLGGLLELVGLIRMVQLISRHALKQQKRAELLGRIQVLKRELLG